MRIIAGELRGRAIDAPEGRDTRPMLDRVREAVFSTLAPWIPGGFVLDLFAGSGSLGFEALSRGARAVRAIERDSRAFGILESNASTLGVADRLECVRGDAFEPAAWGEAPADVVFLDPPYPWLRDARRRQAIFTGIRELLEQAVAPEGVIAFHAPRRAVSPAEFGEGVELSERHYGTNAIWYIARVSQSGAGDGC